MGERPIRVLCVDDSPDITMLLQVAIDAEADMESVGCLHDADELIEEVERSRPDVIVLDLTMPGRDPLETLAQLQKSFSDTRTIAFSGHDDAETIDQVIEAGAWGVVSKHHGMPALIEAIRKVADGEVSL